MASLSRQCLTRQWIMCSEKPSTSMSPVSQLTSQLFHQNLDCVTPRRRLSLDSSLSSPDLEVRVCPATPESSRVCADSSAPECVSRLTSDYASLSDQDAPRSPLRGPSPTPSQDVVFEVDDDNTTDSHDSGFSDYCPNKDKQLGPTEFAMPMFAAPRPRAKTESAMVMDDMGFFDELEELSMAEEGAIGELINEPYKGTKQRSHSFNTTPMRSFKDLTNIQTHGQSNSPVRKSGLSLIQAGQPNLCRKRPKQPSPEIDENCKNSAGKVLPKRRRNTDNSPYSRVKARPRARAFHRCYSENAVSVLQDLDQNDQHLIGDFSKEHCLPLVDHPDPKATDLKSISAQTLSRVLLSGCPDGRVVELVDCRYPYEYAGGHVMGAHHIYEETTMQQRYFSDNQTGDCADRQKILVFYCEYSQQRGPGMYRKLRAQDRKCNEYPSLHYPEVYLLHGGYKNFFENFPDLCEPRQHVRMLDKNYSSELRKFKKSKSFAGLGCSTIKRPGLQRGLFRT